MDVVENEAPYFFRTELRVVVEHPLDDLNNGSSSVNSIPQVLGPFPHPFPPAGSNARNFSNSCVTDDNIAVLLRMPNVILTPHLAFFTKETILRSWLLAGIVVAHIT